MTAVDLVIRATIQGQKKLEKKSGAVSVPS